MSEPNILDLDLYELLDISPDSSIKKIRTAYRKKALKCHPDKNPDDPKAAKTFQQLQKALEILIDENARAAYDKVLQGKKAAKIRHAQLDAKRKKLKEDLEAREKLAESKKNFKSYESPEQKLKAEIERLRKEGSKLVEEELAFIQKQVEEEINHLGQRYQYESNQNEYRLRIKWKAEKMDATNGGYNKENLNKILSQYGEVNALIISSKKKGSALVEFSSYNAACMAQRFEKGLETNPLQIEFLSHSRETKTTQETQSPNVPKKGGLFPSAARNDEDDVNDDNKTNSSSSIDFPSFSFNSTFNVNPIIETSNRDFESLELRKLRQAEERQRLIAQIQAEDKEEEKS